MLNSIGKKRVINKIIHKFSKIWAYYLVFFGNLCVVLLMDIPSLPLSCLFAMMVVTAVDIFVLYPVPLYVNTGTLPIKYKCTLSLSHGMHLLVAKEKPPHQYFR